MINYAEKNRIIIGLLAGFTAIIILIPSAQAQSVGFSLSNDIFDLEIPAGRSYEGQTVVLNNPDSLITPIHIEFSLWNLRDDSDDIEFVTAESALNAAKWFTLEDGTDFILEPQEDREVNFKIDIPSDVSPGSYFVMMRFQSVLPEYYFEAQGPRFIPEIGNLFFIRVPLLTLDGDESLYSANIESLQPEGDDIPFVHNFLPRANAGVFDSAVKKLLANIKNDGIYHFKMSGNIEIKNIFGRTVVSESLPARFLLPNRTRNIDIAVLPPPSTENLPFFQRVFKSTTYNLKTNTYFGPYSAIATLIIPENDLPVVKSVNFWVIPWQFWLIIGILFGGGLFIFRRFGRRSIDRIRLSIKILRGRIKPSE